MRIYKYGGARICKGLRRPGIDSASLCSMAGRYEKQGCCTDPPGWESIPGLLKRFTNTGLRPAMLHRLMELNLRNRFLDYLNFYRYNFGKRDKT